MHNGLRMPAAGKAACVLFRGRRVPVLSVSLEHTTIDLTDLAEPRVGEEVTVLGQDGAERITIEEMAEWQGRSPLEVATISKRVRESNVRSSSATNLPSRRFSRNTHPLGATAEPEGRTGAAAH